MRPDSTAVSRDSSVALYVQIADRVARDITRQRLPAFARLPSEYALTQQYGVSRVTVRQAIGLLVRQGLVVVKQGKGTFVAGPVMQHKLEDLKGFYDALVVQGHMPETQLLEFRPMQAPAGVAARLGTGCRKPVHLRRRYSLQGYPFALVDAWLIPAAAEVSWEAAEHHPIYSILEHLLDMSVARAEVGILARQADARETKLLELPRNSPILMMERVSYSAGELALEFSRFSIRPENYRFSVGVEGRLAITRMIQQAGGENPVPAVHSTHKRQT